MLWLVPCLLLNAAPPPALARAIKSGDLKTVTRALDSGTPVDARLETDHVTLLGLAARAGQVPVVKLLLERGAQVGLANDANITPLLEAMSLDDARALELIRLLKGPFDQGREPPMLRAITLDRPALVTAMLELGADPATRDRLGRTAFHETIRYGRDDLLRLLVKSKKGLEVTDGSGATPLVAAARSHRAAAVRLLVEAGANVNATAHEQSALVFLASYPELVELLLARGADVKRDGTAALCEAVAGNRPESVQLLLAAGAVPEAPRALTPLMVAAHTGNVELTRLFLSKTKQVDAQDEQGRTALHWAAQLNSNVEVMRLLLAAGADSKKKDAGGQNAQQLAEGLGNLDLVRVLIEKEGGAAPDFTNGSWAIVFGGGKTAADAAKWSRWFEAERATLWQPQVVFGAGFPKVMRSDDVPGMNPGFHVVVLGFCGAAELGEVMKIFKGSAERVYVRKLAQPPAGATCPTPLIRNRALSDVWADEAGNRLHVALFPVGKKSTLFITLRSPDGELLDATSQPVDGLGDWLRPPRARVGVLEFTDSQASCGAPSGAQVSISARAGKLVVDAAAVGAPTPYCD